jgi:hypothetical protein
MSPEGDCILGSLGLTIDPARKDEPIPFYMHARRRNIVGARQHGAQPRSNPRLHLRVHPASQSVELDKLSASGIHDFAEEKAWHKAEFTSSDASAIYSKPMGIEEHKSQRLVALSRGRTRSNTEFSNTEPKESDFPLKLGAILLAVPFLGGFTDERTSMTTHQPQGDGHDPGFAVSASGGGSVTSDNRQSPLLHHDDP